MERASANQMIAQWLLILGAAIPGVLGAAHLIFTFFTDKFEAFDSSTANAMKQTSPRISKDTTMWKVRIEFNASHSLGPLIFAAIYIQLSLVNFEMIQQSMWLSLLPVIVGFAYLALAKAYWFTKPFIGILIATTCFLASFILGVT